MKAPVAAAGITESAEGGAPWIDVFELDLSAVNGDDWLIPWFWTARSAAANAVAAFEFDGGAIDVTGVELFSVTDNCDEMAVAGISPFAAMFDADGDSNWMAGFDFSDDGFDGALESFTVDAGSARFSSGVAEATIAH